MAEYMDFLPNVEFRGVVNGAKNCVCNGCHKTGRVLKLKIPETLYYDGKNLTTKYHGYWLCHDCVKKLDVALIDPEGD